MKTSYSIIKLIVIVIKSGHERVKDLLRAFVILASFFSFLIDGMETQVKSKDYAVKPYNESTTLSQLVTLPYGLIDESGYKTVLSHKKDQNEIDFSENSYFTHPNLLLLKKYWCASKNSDVKVKPTAQSLHKVLLMIDYLMGNKNLENFIRKQIVSFVTQPSILEEKAAQGLLFLLDLQQLRTFKTIEKVIVEDLRNNYFDLLIPSLQAKLPIAPTKSLKLPSELGSIKRMDITPSNKILFYTDAGLCIGDLNMATINRFEEDEETSMLPWGPRKSKTIMINSESGNIISTNGSDIHLRNNDLDIIKTIKLKSK